MIVDVYVKSISKDFIDLLDEIKADSQVERFIVHPRKKEALEYVKAFAREVPCLFYCAPLSLQAQCDQNCLAYFLDDPSALHPQIDKPLYVKATSLSDEIKEFLITHGLKGIIMNAKELFEELSDFFVAIGPANIDYFSTADLSRQAADRIVFQSSFPDYGFDDIHESIKQFALASFKPEESIISAATIRSLELFKL